MLYAHLMNSPTIMLPEDLDARVRMEARRRGVSIADIAREAIEQYVAPPAPTGHLGFFAVGEGGPPDASERVDEFSARRSPVVADATFRLMLIVDAGPLYAAAAAATATIAAVLGCSAKPNGLSWSPP